MPSLRRCLAVAVLALLAAPAAASARTAVTDRFEEFARRARAVGELELVLRFRGDSAAGCSQARTCGQTGRVTAKLRMAGTKRIGRASDGLVVLRGTGTVEAVAGDCHVRRSLRTLGLGYTGEGARLLLHPGLPGAGVEDPFATRCAGPGLFELDANGVLPTAVLREVPQRLEGLRLSFERRRAFRDGGFSGSVTASGKLRLLK